MFLLTMGDQHEEAFLKQRFYSKQDAKKFCVEELGATEEYWEQLSTQGIVSWKADDGALVCTRLYFDNSVMQSVKSAASGRELVA